MARLARLEGDEGKGLREGPGVWGGVRGKSGFQPNIVFLIFPISWGVYLGAYENVVLQYSPLNCFSNY